MINISGWRQKKLTPPFSAQIEINKVDPILPDTLYFIAKYFIRFMATSNLIYLLLLWNLDMDAVNPWFVKYLSEVQRSVWSSQIKSVKVRMRFATLKMRIRTDCSDLNLWERKSGKINRITFYFLNFLDVFPKSRFRLRILTTSYPQSGDHVTWILASDWSALRHLLLCCWLLQKFNL